MRWLVIGLAVFLASAVSEAGRRRSNLPERHRWPPTPGMRLEARKCQAELDERGLRWRRARRRREIAAPIILPGMMIGGVQLTPIWRKGPFIMDCHLVLALSQVAESWFALGVRELRFTTIHDVRNVRVRGKRTDKLSRHALGLAIDIFEIVDDQGRTHVVDEHYWSIDLFLPAFESLANASGAFRTVLSPRRDLLSHDDHFHLEAQVRYPREARRKRRSERRRRRSRRTERRKHRSRRR